jgi:hypothetical protein
MTTLFYVIVGIIVVVVAKRIYDRYATKKIYEENGLDFENGGLLYSAKSTSTNTTKKGDAEELLSYYEGLAEKKVIFEPILAQISEGSKNIDIPKNGIFDEWVRGYIFGYVARAIEAMHGATVDQRPDILTDYYWHFFGAHYADSSEYVAFLNQTLQNRSSTKDAPTSDFRLGQENASNDFDSIAFQKEAKNLQKYIEQQFSNT